MFVCATKMCLNQNKKKALRKEQKLRRQGSDEIAKKEKKIDPKLFREYFEYLSPSDMYKNLNKTTLSEKKQSSSKCNKG